MITTTYGYKKPEDRDKGPVVFPAMEENIDRIDSHSHNGVNSPLLSAAALVATSQSILAAAWVLEANSIYKQTVAMPAGLSFDSTIKEFRLSDGTVFQPKIKKVTALSYDIWINDNSETLTVYYK